MIETWKERHYKNKKIIIDKQGKKIKVAESFLRDTLYHKISQEIERHFSNHSASIQRDYMQTPDVFHIKVITRDFSNLTTSFAYVKEKIAGKPIERAYVRVGANDLPYEGQKWDKYQNDKRKSKSD